MRQAREMPFIELYEPHRGARTMSIYVGFLQCWIARRRWLAWFVAFLNGGLYIRQVRTVCRIRHAESLLVRFYS